MKTVKVYHVIVKGSKYVSDSMQTYRTIDEANHQRDTLIAWAAYNKVNDVSIYVEVQAHKIG